MVEVQSKSKFTNWMIVQPATLVANVYDDANGVQGSRLVFTAPRSGRVIIWRFQGEDDKAFPNISSFVISVKKPPKPDDPDDPDEPDNPNPPPKPPVVPNELGVGKPVYDSVMLLSAALRKKYAEGLAQIWSSTGARLAAVSTDPIDPVMEAIAAQTKELLGADHAKWNSYGTAVETAMQAAMDAGRLRKTDRAQVVQLCKEVAGALRIAGGQP
jgi:hypothetical protein